MRIIRAFMALLALVHCAKAAEITATSASSTDVSAAINSAAIGDTVRIPAGSATWTGTQVVGKDIIIIGAGIGNTTISKSTAGPILQWSNNIRARLSGVTLINSATSTSAYCISLRGQNNVVGYCRFEGVTSKVVGVLVSGGSMNPMPTGVVHHCEFYKARVLVEGDLNNTTSKFGRRIWANSDAVAEVGGPNTIFFEDCTLDRGINIGQNLFDADYGGHYVVRHCTLINGTVYGHPGRTIGAVYARGTKFIECYENSFQFSGALVPGDPPMWARAGAMIAWNNSITSTAANLGGLYLTGNDEIVDRRYGTSPNDGNQPVTNGTGTHTGANGAAALTDGTKAWASNSFLPWTVYNLTDGSKGTITANTATTVTATLSGGTVNVWNAGDSYKVTNGYPLRDQCGRGTDSALWVDPAAAPSQAASPCYQWNNTRNGVSVNWVVGEAAAPNSVWIQLNRDYFNASKAGYVAYTYPHPLISGAPPPPPPPPPPPTIVTPATNLRIIPTP